MANQPCCTNDPNCFCIPFTNNQQDYILWCWAAVTANIFNSMFTAGPQLLQCDVVAKVKGHALGDPCMKANHAKYQDEDIGTAFDDFKISDGFEVPVAMATLMATLVAELRGGAAAAKPVALQINLKGGAIHYIAISGVHTDTQTICVADPRYGGDPVELALNDLSNYGYQNDVPAGGGTGVATKFQLVKRPGAH